MIKSAVLVIVTAAMVTARVKLTIPVVAAVGVVRVVLMLAVNVVV